MQIFFRRGTAADAASNNTTLLAGEPGFETDTGLFKIGDGSTAWNALPYLNDKRKINTQAASYTLVLTDQNTYVRMNNGSANNLTVPTNASVAFPVGTQIDMIQKGAGQTTVVASGGVTINSKGGALKLSAQWAAATLVKVGTNEWDLVGDIAT